MRKLLVTPAFDRKSESSTREAELAKMIAFLENRDRIIIFNIKNGEEVEIPASHVFEYKEYILINGTKYDIMERSNYE